MMLSKHLLACSVLLLWATTAAATPLLQGQPQVAAPGQDLLLAQASQTHTKTNIKTSTSAPPALADQAQPPAALDGSLVLPVLRSAEPTAGSINLPTAAAAADSAGRTGSTASVAPAGNAAERLLGSISADAWAQIAALATAGCAALGLWWLRRSGAAIKLASNPAAAAAARAKADPKRRRVAYRL